jgi:tetratricopeptide (TPR) repeat protein
MNNQVKNVVGGNISNVGTVDMGDKHYHIEPSKNLPKALTNKIPRTSRDKIVGRSADLDTLHERLFDNRQVVLVNGMGGIGKTTLAQVYVHEYWEEYSHIAWISQLSGKVTDDFINAEGLLHNLAITSEGKNADELFCDVISELNRIEKTPNLLVIDNADSTLVNYYDYLPGQPSWHVLVTSRERIEKYDILEIDFLSEQEAVELFLWHYTHQKIPLEKIAGLVKLVDLHTLTIEILAKTAQLQRIGMEQLERAIADDVKANVFINSKGDKIERVTSYLCSIFTMSTLSEHEILLLKQFVCLPSEFHQYDLLEMLIQPEKTVMGEQYPEVIEALSSKGWLLRNPENDSYRMHRIIADVVKKQCGISIEDVVQLIETITELLNVDYTKDNPVDKFQWITFGKSMLDVFFDSEDTSISTLQNNLATVLQELGDYDGAKTLLQKAMRSDEKNFGPDHPNTARSYSNLALVLKDLGDYEGAKTLHQKAMCSYEKDLGPDHPYTAISYSNFALVLQDLGDYDGAKTLLQKAISSNEKNFGVDHPNTATSYSNLALVLRDFGDYEGAKTLLQKAMHSAEKNLGPDHPRTAIRYSNLALVLRDFGDYEGAKTLLQKAMHSAEKNFGVDHPNTATSYSNLALVLQDLGDYEGAKTLHQKAMCSYEKDLGPDHPYTAGSYSNLASVLQDLGDYDGAKTLLQKATSSNEKNFGPDHPSTARSYSNLASVLQDLGDYDGAKTLLQKATSSNEKNFSPDHPSTAICYSNLATVLQDLGDYEEALKLSEKAVQIFTKVLPAGHPTIKTVTENYDAIKNDIAQQQTFAK